MKIRLLLLVASAFSLIALGIVGLPVEAASIPCHECSDEYDSCAADAENDYTTCLANGNTFAFCSSERQDALDVCDMAEGACYSTCFECPEEGEEF